MQKGSSSSLFFASAKNKFTITSENATKGKPCVICACEGTLRVGVVVCVPFYSGGVTPPLQEDNILSTDFKKSLPLPPRFGIAFTNYTL